MFCDRVVSLFLHQEKLLPRKNSWTMDRVVLISIAFQTRNPDAPRGESGWINCAIITPWVPTAAHTMNFKDLPRHARTSVAWHEVKKHKAGTVFVSFSALTLSSGTGLRSNYCSREPVGGTELVWGNCWLNPGDTVASSPCPLIGPTHLFLSFLLLTSFLPTSP